MQVLDEADPEVVDAGDIVAGVVGIPERAQQARTTGGRSGSAESMFPGKGVRVTAPVAGSNFVEKGS